MAVDVQHIEIEDMKSIMKKHIDNIHINDVVAFSVHFDKAKDDDTFIRSIEIMIDTGFDEDEGEKENSVQ